MATPYPCSHNALVALFCSLAAASAALNPVVDHDAFAEDGMSAFVSSNGVKFIAKERSNRENDDTQDEWQAVDAANGVHKAADPSSLAAVPTLPGSSFFNSQAGTRIPDLDYDRRSNAIYFVIGIGTFLLALVLIQIVLRKLNFLEEPEELLQESQNMGNPQDEEPAGVLQDDPTMERQLSSSNPEHPGNHVPFRVQQVLVSWLFIIASISLFCDYLAMQAGFDKARHYFGMAAGFLWLIGFLIQFHWQLTVGSSRIQIFAAFLKVNACILLQVHPFCRIAGMAESDPIVWWPGLAALFLWHGGNIVSCTEYYVHPPASSDRNASFVSYGNLAMTELVIDALATQMLCIASICVVYWWGDTKAQLVDPNNYGVLFCEFGGAFLFLLASCVKCEWCNGFRNYSHATAA